MKLTTFIVPRSSIGGISIGENIYEIEGKLHSMYSIERVGCNMTKINRGVITAYHDVNGEISQISCNKYFNGNYRDKLWPGMLLSDVLNHSTEQVAWSGFLQIDGIQGIGLSLPDEYDDFESITDFLSLDFVFNELWVYNF